MTSNKTPVTYLSTFLSTLLVVAVWLLFTPVQFGGQTGYVIINGNSMEPNFYRGDLVLLRTAPDYHIGEVATYQHPDVGPVIHRIIDKADSRFILQGDNNSWVDSYQPHQDEMIGKLWLYLPQIGKVLDFLRIPWVTALTLVIFGVGPFVFSKKATNEQVHHRRRKKQKRRNVMQAQPNTKTELLFVAGGLGLAFAILVVFSFSRPLTKSEFQPISYKQSGTFSYTAPAPTAIYPDGAIETGQPIFRQLVNNFTVTFDYQQSASALPYNLAGTHRLLAEIKHSSGWQWKIDLLPTMEFHSDSFRLTAPLDLDRIQTVTDNFEQQTGLKGQSYNLIIKPEIELEGAVAGKPAQNRFAPTLTFNLDKLQVRPAPDSEFSPSVTNSIDRVKTLPNTVSLFNFQISVLTLRFLGVIGLLISLACSLGLGALLLHGPHRDESAQVSLKYGAQMVTIKNLDLKLKGRVIDVATIDDLVKISNRSGSMILHQVQGRQHHYLVQDTDVIYRYLIEVLPEEKSPSLTKLRVLS